MLRVGWERPLTNIFNPADGAEIDCWIHKELVPIAR